MTSRVLNNLNSTSVAIDEQNNASTNATNDTPQSGLFITPSTISGRLADVTGMVVAAMTSQGKLGFVSTDDIEPNITPTGTATQALIADPITINAIAGVVTLANITFGPQVGDTITMNNSFISDSDSMIFTSTVGYTGTYGVDSNLVIYPHTPTPGQVDITIYNDSETRSFDGAFSFSFFVL